MEGEVFGHYRLDALIGRGGMGEVFRAVDLRRNRVVALKRLPGQLASDDAYRQRFQREAALVARLNEPHIIPIHDYGEIDGRLFLDMRLVEGGDLATELADGPLPVARAVHIVSQIADALDAAHAAGLVHRDVKPPNVLIVPAPGGDGREVVYLTDFGIARQLDGPTLSQAGAVMGTLGYMAPERFTGDDWDARVDVYSLACVLFECLVGRKPFRASSVYAAMHAHLNEPPPRPTAERSGLSEGLDAVVARGMAKDPADRYPTAGALAAAARAQLAEPFTVPAPQPARPRARTPRLVPLPAGGAPPAGTGGSGPLPAPAPPPDSGPAAVAPARLPRRRLLTIAGAVVAAGVVGAGTWAGLRAAGVIPAAGPWRLRTGGEVYSSPAVADGALYVGSNDRYLYAVDAATGRERWRYLAAGAITSSPAVAGGVVFVGGNDQRLHAVDAASGATVWRFDTGGVVHSSPAVAGGLVYVGCRADQLWAVDAATGVGRWTFEGGDWFNSSPAVAGERVFVGCRDGRVYCVDARSGTRRWQHVTSTSVDSSPTVVDGTVYIGSDARDVLALEATGGTQRWSFRAGGGVASSPAVADGTVYVGSDDGNLYALDADTGRERWRHRTGGGIRSSPAVAGGLVYVGSADGSLYAVDTGGVLRWQFRTGGPIADSSPAVVDGLVVVGSTDGTVYAVDAATGQGPA
ncbi:PQQ-binding-like beta-propeller repeat protein [Pseudonocardia sp.]|uniref:outer membrane protein assembly factor BamB family protein n=1 Tax=Pseudonocardia sp. TaxID=60912 RepID=UPI003D119636